ncbi:hypothetical protein VQ056_04315 [Paenibacillus sp. JTLBN-2024]
MSIVRLTVIGRGRLHDRLEEGMAEELLHAFRRQAVQAAEGPGGFRGLVWIESFEIRSGPWIDREALLQEDSFLGELAAMRKAGRPGRTDPFRVVPRCAAASGGERRAAQAAGRNRRRGADGGGCGGPKRWRSCCWRTLARKRKGIRNRMHIERL